VDVDGGTEDLMIGWNADENRHEQGGGEICNLVEWFEREVAASAVLDKIGEENER